MRRRKHWRMEWVVFVPSVGHFLIQYEDGRLVGAYRDYLEARG